MSYRYPWKIVDRCHGASRNLAFIYLDPFLAYKPLIWWCPEQMKISLMFNFVHVTWWSEMKTYLSNADYQLIPLEILWPELENRSSVKLWSWYSMSPCHFRYKQNEKKSSQLDTQAAKPVSLHLHFGGRTDIVTELLMKSQEFMRQQKVSNWLQLILPIHLMNSKFCLTLLPIVQTLFVIANT